MARYFEKIAGTVGRRLIRYAAGDSGILRHAIHEWAKAFPEKDEMQDAVGESVFDVCSIFSLAGHSGSSAPYTIGFIEKALSYRIFSPLTGADDEWMEYAEEGGISFFQNRRDSRVFKNGRDGQAYMIDGRIYREPDGCAYTRGGEKVDLPPFPCYPPEPVYIDVTVDGEEIVDLTDAMARFEFANGDVIDLAPTPDQKVAATWTASDGISVDKVIPLADFHALALQIFHD